MFVCSFRDQIDQLRFLNLIPEKDCGNAEKKLQYMETLNSNDCPENLGFWIRISFYFIPALHNQQ